MVQRQKQPVDYTKVKLPPDCEWTILGVAGFDGVAGAANYVKKMRCRCSCGVERDVQYANLRSGQSKSCGHAGRGREPFNETIGDDEITAPIKTMRKVDNRLRKKQREAIHGVKAIQPLSPDTRRRLVKFCIALGQNNVAKSIGMERHAFNRVLRGRRTRVSSRTKVLAWLKAQEDQATKLTTTPNHSSPRSVAAQELAKET